jgi:hypothetical protein
MVEVLGQGQMRGEVDRVDRRRNSHKSSDRVYHHSNVDIGGSKEGRVLHSQAVGIDREDKDKVYDSVDWVGIEGLLESRQRSNLLAP